MSNAGAADDLVLKLQNVGVSYRVRSGLFKRELFWALQDVSFDLRKGESLGVIGGNGSGKSTLLRIIAGIIDPDRGRVERGQLRAALVSLRLGFLPHLTGRQNAMLSAMLMGSRRREAARNLDKIIAFSELEAFIDQPLRTYSAGMKARLGFAVAFQFDPDILLIDEALGVGDAEFRNKSTELMRRKIRSDKSAVIVSHNLAVIRSLCDRVVWIDKGVTKLVGETERVLAAYGDANPVARPRRGRSRTPRLASN